LRGAGLRIGDHPALEDSCPQPASQQLQHLPVNHPAFDLAHEGVVVDVVEARLDVSVEHPPPTLVGCLADSLEGLVRRTLRAEPEAHRMEVSLEDRLKDDLRCRHDHPVGNGGDAERSGLPWPARLGDVHPPQRLGPVGAGSKRRDEFVEEGSHRLDALTTLQTSLDAADRPVAPPRFEPGLSTGPGGFTTGDPGVSPDRTLTGWLSRA
jgi:hypothetical protein